MTPDLRLGAWQGALATVGEVDAVECHDCSGMGAHERGNACGVACGWCGGCYDHEDCDACAGTGMVCEENEE